MQNKSIKNIIFDLGNVIINIDGDLTIKAMKELGFNDPASSAGGFEKSYTLLRQSNLFDLLEKGLITSEQFHTELKTYFQDSVTADQIDKAWGAMLLDFPKGRIELLQKLSKKYRLFLLSNTNAIHYHQYNNDLIDQFGFDLSSLFEKAYYSFEIGMRKPDIEIFEHALNDSKLNPAETLFIDDLDKNIETAKKADLQTMWIDISKRDDIIDKLNGF